MKLDRRSVFRSFFQMLGLLGAASAPAVAFLLDERVTKNPDPPAPKVEWLFEYDSDGWMRRATKRDAQGNEEVTEYVRDGFLPPV